jgi:hypothetical protein
LIKYFFVQASGVAKRSSGGLFTVGDVLVNRSSINETKTIESKTMTMTFTKANPDGMIHLFFVSNKKIVSFVLKKVNQVYQLVIQVFVYLVLMI